MSHAMAPPPTGNARASARDILDGMSRYYRIDPTRIQVTDSVPVARGGQGVVVVGTLIARKEFDVFKTLPHEVFEELFSDELMESIPVAIKELLPEEIKNLPLKEFTRVIREGFTEMMMDQKVAIKQLEWPRGDGEQSARFFKSFINELSLMTSLSHPNIIEFLGFVEDMEKGNAWIILPWEANGNVRDFLRSGEWDIPERVSLILDTANGLKYLHTRDPPICHGDLKSLNILVNSSHRAVITDFGSSRIRQNLASKNQSEAPCQTPVNDGVVTSPKVTLNRVTLDLTLTGPIGTLRWSAPEVMRGEMPDLPSDMWAIGWICWEIVTGRLPFEELNREESVIAYTITGKLPPIREDAQLSHILMLCNLMSNCWISQPAQRIDASTFQRKASMLPSEAPSSYTPEGQKARSPRLLVQLGRMYEIQADRVRAESHYLSALDAAIRKADDAAEANGDPLEYTERPNYREAKCLSMQAQDMPGQVENSSSTVTPLGGLREIDRAPSDSLEPGGCFTGARRIDSRISDDFDAANALMCLGNTYRDQLRLPEAEKALNAAYEIHSRIGNDLGAANVLNLLGETHRTQLKYQEAEKAFDAAHEIHSSIGHDLGAANALDGLGETYFSQSKGPEAVKAFHAAHEIHSRAGNDLGVANALVGLGETYSSQSMYQAAEKAFHAAHEIHSRIGQSRGAANALHGLGGTYHHQLKFQEAENAYSAAHEINSQIGYDMGTANALYGLGETYRAQSRYQEAENAFGAAHEIHSRMGNHHGMGVVLTGLGETYRVQARYQEAEKALNDARTIYSWMSDSCNAGNSFHALGKLHSDQGRYNDAELCYRQALASYDHAGRGSSRARALMALGALYHTQDRYIEAEESVNEALAIFTSIAEQPGQAAASISLSYIYRSQSKHRDELDALALAEAALVLIDNPPAHADTLHRMGELQAMQDNYPKAEEFYHLAQAIYLSLDDGHGEANELRSLGWLYARQGRPAEAEKGFARARLLSAALLDEEGEAKALDGLIGAYTLQMKFEDAKVVCIDARKIYTRTGQPMSWLCSNIGASFGLWARPSTGPPLAGLFNSFFS